MTDLTSYMRTLRRWAWLIVAVTLISVVTSALVSLELPKQYESTAVVLVNPKQVILPGADTGLSTQLDQLIQTYAQLISNKPVWDQLISDGIPRTQLELKKAMIVKREPNTSLIDVTFRDHDPEVSLRAAQDVIPAFNKSLGELQTRFQGAGAAPKLDSLVPWSVPSDAPTNPVSPNVPLNVGVALVVGLMIAVALALLLEYLDDTVKNEYDVRLRLELPLLGSIFFKKTMARTPRSRDVVALVTLTHPKEPIAEAFKAIRTSLLFSVAEDQQLSTIVVTSTMPGEGKTSTACNLAIAMAQSGKRVILIDADFRRPNLHEVFRRPRNAGLGNMMLEDRLEDELIAPTELPNLKVVCSGPTAPNPSELLGSPRFQRLLRALKEKCDVIILDTPPVGAVTDATVLAARADGVVLVVDGAKTPVSAVIRTRDTLLSVNAKILGVVLNKMRTAEGRDYYYYYGPELAQEGARAATPEPKSARWRGRQPRPAKVRNAPVSTPSPGHTTATAPALAAPALAPALNGNLAAAQPPAEPVPAASDRTVGFGSEPAGVELPSDVAPTPATVAPVGSPAPQPFLDSDPAAAALAPGAAGPASLAVPPSAPVVRPAASDGDPLEAANPGGPMSAPSPISADPFRRGDAGSAATGPSIPSADRQDPLFSAQPASAGDQAAPAGAPDPLLPSAPQPRYAARDPFLDPTRPDASSPEAGVIGARTGSDWGRDGEEEGGG
ncbi:MAG: polysaccharide biosynthesis tyrosine autokinase [Candidatus Dormibacteria bacterium]